MCIDLGSSQCSSPLVKLSRSVALQNKSTFFARIWCHLLCVSFFSTAPKVSVFRSTDTAGEEWSLADCKTLYTAKAVGRYIHMHLSFQYLKYIVLLKDVLSSFQVLYFKIWLFAKWLAVFTCWHSCLHLTSKNVFTQVWKLVSDKILR